MSCSLPQRAHQIGLVVLLVITTACGSTGGLFTYGPRPHELAGVWVDSSKSTPTDTIAWTLAESGEDGTLHISVARDSGGARVSQTRTRYGNWYVDGSMADSASRRLCFKRRPRDGPTCNRFRIDSLANRPRRLTILGYHSAHHVGDRTLFERLP